MQYDDDFDEEDFYDKTQGQKKKYQVEMARKQRPKEESKGSFGEKNMVVSEEISEIAKKSESDNFNPQDEFDLEDEDDNLDFMDKFIEGADVELVKDHSASFQDDEKLARMKEKRQLERQREENKAREKGNHDKGQSR